MEHLNKRIPKELQMTHPTGHSGRHSFCSISMNAEGSDAVATAIGSGHRDPKSLAGYIVPSRDLKTKAAITIGKATMDVSERTAGKKRALDGFIDSDCFSSDGNCDIEDDSSSC